MKKYRLALENKSGEVITTELTDENVMPVAMDFIEAMLLGKGNIKGVKVEVIGGKK